LVNEIGLIQIFNSNFVKNPSKKKSLQLLILLVFCYGFVYQNINFFIFLKKISIVRHSAEYIKGSLRN